MGVGPLKREGKYLTLYDEGDNKFFSEHIQKYGATAQLVPAVEAKTSPQSLMRKNAAFFKKALARKTPEERENIANFILANCNFRVVVSPNFAAASRTYESENSRGTGKLSNADSIKAAVLNVRDMNEAQICAEKWNRIDDAIGDAEFGNLLRCIYIQEQGELPETPFERSFAQNIIRQRSGRDFIDNVLLPACEIFQRLENNGFDPSTDNLARVAVEIMETAMRQRTTHSMRAWYPTAMAICHKYTDDPAAMVTGCANCRYGLSMRCFAPMGK